MQLTVLGTNPSSLRAGYSCPCGCTPSVEYHRGEDLAQDGCCCGNHFAIGPDAASRLLPTRKFRSEFQTFAAPWGEQLEAAWLVGPSTHEEHHHAEEHAQTEHAIDPVCGMSVDPQASLAKGLSSVSAGTDYFFCGKGCKLEFDDDPERYLDPGYVPSM